MSDILSSDRVKFAQEMIPGMWERICSGNVSRRVLQTMDSEDTTIRYDINTVYMPSHGANPERGPAFAPFFEIVSAVEHSGISTTIAEAEALCLEGADEIRNQEDSNLFAMADMATTELVAKNLISAVKDLVSRGATTVAVCGYQYCDPVIPGRVVYKYMDNERLVAEVATLSKTYPDIVIIPTLSVPKNKVYGFAGVVGEMWVSQELEGMATTDVDSKKHGFIFAEGMSVGITKPECVFKISLS